MDSKIEEIKPVIRSILLALGRRATVREFLTEFKNTEGQEFKSMLNSLSLNFYDFVQLIPDVARVWNSGDEIYIERVSTADSSHMDRLTIVKKKKKRPLMSSVSKFPSRPLYTNPYRNSATSSYHKSYTKANSAPKRPLYQSISLKPLPPAPHQTMKPVVFKADSLNDKGTKGKENVAPNGQSSTVPKHPSKTTTVFHNSTPSTASLPPPIHITMKPVVFKGNKDIPTEEEAHPWIGINRSIEKLKKENVRAGSTSSPLSHPTVPITTVFNEQKEDAIGSPWVAVSKEKIVEEAAKYQTMMAKMEAFEISTKPVVMTRETNPFKTTEEGTVAKKCKPLVAAQEVPRPAASKTLPTLRAPFDDIKKQWDMKDYHTIAHSIPDTKMRATNDESFFQVELVETSSPSQFMFKYKAEMLQNLLDEMNLHYKSLEHSKHLAVRKLLPGMSVAVFDDGKWQRVEVLCVSDSDIYVFFVDAGSKRYVKSSNIRYLEKTFGAMPRSCYKGCLFGVKPKSGETLWSASAIMKFIQKTKGVKMYASIKEHKDGMFHLSLVDDVIRKTRVSVFMVQEGLADAVMVLDYSKNAILI